MVGRVHRKLNPLAKKGLKKPPRWERNFIKQRFVLIDGKDHLAGRLGSIVAKQLLMGKKVVVVRCEKLNMSGALYRNRINPKKGPYHYRAPSRMFARIVRGMLPYRTSRGSTAFKNLKTYEGIPPVYNAKKRMVVPQALRVLRMSPDRKYTVFGDLAKLVGWKYSDVIDKLEEKRKNKNTLFYERHKKMLAAKNKALEDNKGKLNEIDEKLAKYGY